MVHIEKNYNNPPAELINSKWDNVKKSVLVEKNNHNAQSECYRDTTLEALTNLYSNKCACCERSRGEELQIDHYRPKKARNNKTNTEYNHSGYYWLTYEWSNLIPLCSSCNQAKSNFFPLQDNTKRISEHTHLKANNIVLLQDCEKPLFVNPEIDKLPEQHFLYLPNGKVEGRTPEGVAMVKFYNMNSRPKIRDRKKILSEYTHEIKEAIDRFYKSTDTNKKHRFEGSLETTFSKIKRKMNKKCELSQLHFFINQYFEVFIANKFPKEWKAQITDSFLEFKSHKV